MKEETKSLIKTVIVMFAIAFLLRASVVEAYKIPSASMEPTLQVSDHILVNKLSYGLWLPLVKESVIHFRQPQRGDVVVFTLPDDPTTPAIDDSDTNIIKRVIGLPGETVEVRGKHVYINGKILEDEYALWDRGGAQDFGPKIIPEGRVFLLGDNRDHSRDSRFWPEDTQFLDIRRIKGRAFFIYFTLADSLHRIFNIIR